MDERPEVPQAPNPDLADAIRRARGEKAERAKAMDEKPEAPQAPKPDLAGALRRSRGENAERAEAMDEKPEAPQEPKPDLAAALRRARVENAERADAIAELREIELGRLALLESELKPVVRQAPPGVDLFDLTLSQGERPRVFLDMVAFVEMGRDRRTYRFFQDTVHGRVLIAQSQRIDKIVAAVTNYVARRLVERERALAAERETGEERQPAAWSTRPVAGEAEGELAPAKLMRGAPRPAAFAASPAPVTPAAPPRRTIGRLIGDAFGFLLMTLGSITLICLIAIAAYLAWTARARELWSHWFGQPPF